MKSQIKYAVRRLLLGVVIVPLVAITYTIGYGLLVGLSTGGFVPVSEVWSNGLLFGYAVTIWFAGMAFFPNYFRGEE